MIPDLADDRRHRRLRPDDVVRAHRRERDRRRPELELVCCDGCGAELAMARQGASAWCVPCRRWSGSAMDAEVRT